ncbi:MAG: NADH-quinone oxidoreductase subunit NuoE [Thermodesulfobacteriota bacterium]
MILRPENQNKSVLTEEVRSEMLAAISACQQKECAALDVLLIAKRHYGWISDEMLNELAAILEMSTSELDSAATFYNQIYRKPIGRHVILVCDSVSCWIMGYDLVREHLIARLGIELGQTTPDGRFTLLPIQCLGACDQAPAVMVDGELFVNLDATTIDEILQRYS